MSKAVNKRLWISSNNLSIIFPSSADNAYRYNLNVDPRPPPILGPILNRAQGQRLRLNPAAGQTNQLLHPNEISPSVIHRPVQNRNLNLVEPTPAQTLTPSLVDRLLNPPVLVQPKNPAQDHNLLLILQPQPLRLDLSSPRLIPPVRLTLALVITLQRHPGPLLPPNLEHRPWLHLPHRHLPPSLRLNKNRRPEHRNKLSIVMQRRLLLFTGVHPRPPGCGYLQIGCV